MIYLKHKLIKIVKLSKIFFKFLTKILNFFIIFLIFFLFLLTKWLLKYFNFVSFDEILFNIFMPIKGTEQNLIDQFLKLCLIPSLVLSIIVFFIFNKLFNLIQKNSKNIIGHYLFNKNRRFNIYISNKNLIFMLNIKNIKLKFNVSRNLIKIFLIVVEMFFLNISISYGIRHLKIDQYFKQNYQNSNFIQNHYVDPKKVKISFPKVKRNLIYIFAESMESSFFSKELGGNENFNLMQPITELCEQNLNFSHNEKFGGAFSTFGSTFTTAGLVSQTLGIPLKIDSKIINIQKNHSCFLNNVYGLGNILKKAGYNQLFLIGSDKSFGNRDILMKNHGNFKIFDYFSAIKEKKIDSNYKVWWGFEDSKLFKFAKEKLSQLSNKKQPFNLTILTTNTHCPEGFIEKNCETKFSDQYSNAIYYSVKQINSFIKWVQKQPFYKNTTIVVVGDHLSMATKHFEKWSNKFDRTIFNLFINYKSNLVKSKNRIFNSLDLFPTTLASLDVNIQGNRLGLGTNLFSSLKTLSEIYGIKFLNAEFKKNSNFYNMNFIYKK